MAAKKPQSKDWQIAELYQKSWAIIKKNKVLWLFGLATAGLSWNSSSNLKAEDFNFLQKYLPPEASGPISQVAGANIDSQSFLPFFSQLFAAIPTYFYVFLATEVLLLIVLWVILAVVNNAWAKGGLVAGTHFALTDKKVSISECSEGSFRALKSLIWLMVVPGLLVALGALLGFGLLGVGLAFTSGFFRFFFGLLLVVALLVFFYVLIMLCLSQIWAVRKVVIDRLPAKQAFWEGYRLAKKKLGPMLLLGLVNLILGILVITVIVAPFIGLLVGGLMTAGANWQLSRILFYTAIVLGILLAIAVTIVPSIINAFKATVWTMAYEKIKGKNERE